LPPWRGKGRVGGGGRTCPLKEEKRESLNRKAWGKKRGPSAVRCYCKKGKKLSGSWGGNRPRTDEGGETPLVVRGVGNRGEPQQIEKGRGQQSQTARSFS